MADYHGSAFNRAKPEASTGGADIVVHVPRLFLWTFLFALFANLLAGSWFAATLTSNFRHVSVEVEEHLIIGAHAGADNRITRLEAVVDTLVEEERLTRSVLYDIRTLLANDRDN